MMLLTKLMSRYVMLSCLALVALGGCQPQPVYINSDYEPKGLKVSGTAKVRAKPTLAVLVIGYSSYRPTAKLARTDTDNRMKVLLAAVQSQGIDAKEVQTSEYRLFQNMVANTPKDWTCLSMLEIRIKDVAKTGEVLDACLDAGANKVDSIEYTIENLAQLRSQARDEACKVAKEKAEQYARNLGVKVGKPIMISESDPQGWSYSNNVAVQSMSYEGRGEARGPADQVLSTGSVSVSLRVDVSYQL